MAHFPKAPKKKGKTGRGRGRPTKFSPERAAKIIEALHAGNYLETAAAYAGVSQVTVRAWIKAGERGKNPALVAFAASVAQAQAAGEVRLVAIVSKSAERQWKAAMTMLERKWPKRWGRRDLHLDDPDDDGREREILVTFGGRADDD